MTGNERFRRTPSPAGARRPRSEDEPRFLASIIQLADIGLVRLALFFHLYYFIVSIFRFDESRSNLKFQSAHRDRVRAALLACGHFSSVYVVDAIVFGSEGRG